MYIFWKNLSFFFYLFTECSTGLYIYIWILKQKKKKKKKNGGEYLIFIQGTKLVFNNSQIFASKKTQILRALFICAYLSAGKYDTCVIRPQYFSVKQQEQRNKTIFLLK